MKRFFSFGTWLGVCGSLSVLMLGLPYGGQAAATSTHKKAAAKSTKSTKKVAAKPAAKAPVKSRVGGKDELPDIQTTDTTGFDKDPRILAQEYGKQANTYYSMAERKEKAGRLDEAQRLYFKSLAVRQKVWGFTDPAEAPIIYKIGEIHQKKGRLNEAEVCYKRGIALLSKRLGPGSYELTKPLDSLGQIALKQKRYQDAVDNYTRVVQLQERNSGAESADTTKARLNLIESQVGLHDWNDAEKQLRLADQALTSKNDTHSRNYLKLLDNYAAVTTALNRTAEANTYSSKAQALRGELDTTAANPAETPASGSDAKGAESEKKKPAKGKSSHSHSKKHVASKK
jgi:hypothetical protein